jgi:hypothetical protein
MIIIHLPMQIYDTDINCQKYKGSRNIISCGVLSGNNEIVTHATRMLIERISGIMTIYKVNTPNLEYVKISWEWMSKDLFGPRFKRKNTENKMFGKYVVPPSISWKGCFTTQNMKMSRVNFLSSSFLFYFFLLQDILWWHIFFLFTLKSLSMSVACHLQK